MLKCPSVAFAGLCLALLVGTRALLVELPNTRFVTFLDVVSGALAMAWAVQTQMAGSDPFLVKSFWIGTALGMVWEVFFDVLGDGFCSVLAKELLFVPGTRAVAHSLLNGVIFVVGIWLCRDLLGGKGYSVASSFSITELSIMFLWGNLQEIFVDYVGQDWVRAVAASIDSSLSLSLSLCLTTSSQIWSFHPGFCLDLGYGEVCNGVMLEFDGRKFTWAPQLTWVVAPFVFYCALLAIGGDRSRREASTKRVD